MGTFKIINRCSNGGQLVPAVLTTSQGWTLERLLRYMVDEAHLWRQELYRGFAVTLDIHGEDDAAPPLMSYQVTASYTRGLHWQPMEA